MPCPPTHPPTSRQINGMMVSTAADGIGIFKPYNV